MSLLWTSRLALAAGAIFFAPCLLASGLRLRAIEGNGMVVSANAASSRKIVVVAEDEDGQPLKGVTIRFRLPAEGPSGHFASGLSSESLLSAADGRAAVIGIVWNNQPGRLLLGVSASFQDDTAELEIPVEIGGQRTGKDSALVNPGHPPSSGIRKKWLILAATVAGAAAIGVAASALKGNSNPAEPVIPPPIILPSTPPVVGTPTIGIGVPH